MLSFFRHLLDKLMRFMRGDQMQQGELTVVGSDSAIISLNSNTHPAKITVHFHGPPTVIPCSPHQHDELQWSCSQGANGVFDLTISWIVSGERDIKWEASW